MRLPLRPGEAWMASTLFIGGPSLAAGAARNACDWERDTPRPATPRRRDGRSGRSSVIRVLSAGLARNSARHCQADQQQQQSAAGGKANVETGERE